MIERTSGLHGKPVIDAEGTALGRVGHVYRSTDGGQPTWFTVKKGGRHRFVPSVLAELDSGGRSAGRVRVATSARHVGSAPQARTSRTLDAPTEAALYAHYGLLEDATTPEDATTAYGTRPAVSASAPHGVTRIASGTTGAVPLRTRGGQGVDDSTAGSAAP